MAARPIDEIKATLEVGSIVPQVNVLEWMKSDEIDLQAAIVTLLSERIFQTGRAIQILAAAYDRAQEWAAAIDRKGPIESPES